MGTITCPEIREELGLSPKERAQARDSFVRSFERQFSDWSEIARVCVEIERDRDYILLGYPSWHQWLLEAAPRSRAYIYIVCGRYKELSPDYSDEELSQIPLRSADVLAQVSPSVRKVSRVRQAARGEPADLRQVIQQEFPEQHIEGIIEKRVRFTTSQWAKIESAFEQYKLVDETASLAVFFEWLVSECQ